MKKNQAMSDSERELMKLVWDNGGSIFIAELLDKVEMNSKEWKRTTVLTFLNRLTEKGFIVTEKHGRMNRYIATISEGEYMANQTRTFLKDVYGGNAKDLVASLLQQDYLSGNDFEELNKYWNEGWDKKR
ncbi:MAG TPA: BlaI/MecI/CopY family transcriptional regulator [Lachnospiraceae bacterium]|nr:BlaI/MecI/CopY family transcriptional regulator [Lachnospiraceae bacterium]